MTGDFLNPVPTNPTQTQVDPHTRAPRTDAYSIGVDREIAGTLSVGAVYVHKNGRDFIGWEDIGGTYREESRTVNGVTIPVFVLTNAPAARLFNLTNQPDYSLTYDGVAFVVEKRRLTRLAGERVVHLVEGVGSAALQRHDRCRRAGRDHGRAARVVRAARHIRARSETR